MRKELIVTADLGHVNVFQLIREQEEEQAVEMTPRLELKMSFDTLAAHGKLSEKLSDSRGMFSRDTHAYGTHNSGTGERHEIMREMQRRLIRTIASNIQALLRQECCTAWMFAAPQTINEKVLACMDPEIRARLRSNLHADIVKVPKQEILERFLAPAMA